jgi:outer membrane protein assembly factor BamB
MRFRKHNAAVLAVLPRQLALARLLLLLAALLALILATLSPALAQSAFPEVIPLPNAFQPEGIAVGRGPTFFVGSIPTGAIYRGDLRTGEGDILVPAQAGRSAIGLDYDSRTGYLFVSGGNTGQAYVYDGETGETKAVYDLAAGMVFINDVIVTRDAAYFTNSFQPFIYRVPLGPGGKLLANPDIETIPLSGDFVQVPNFNANGITAPAHGKWLIIVHSSLGALYKVDPETGHAAQISLSGGAVPNGDGILLQGNTLYVVQNQLNQIAVIELSAKHTSGEIVAIIQDEDFRIPTTIAAFGPYLYAVNARFGTPVTPDTEYEVVQVKR